MPFLDHLLILVREALDSVHSHKGHGSMADPSSVRVCVFWHAGHYVQSIVYTAWAACACYGSFTCANKPCQIRAAGAQLLGRRCSEPCCTDSDDDNSSSLQAVVIYPICMA